MINCDSKSNFGKAECKKEIGEARFSLILPKNDNSGRPIKVQILQKYIGKVNKIFGGSTTMPITKGCYIDKKQLQCEDGFEIIAVRDFESKYDKTKKLRKFDAKQRQEKLDKDYKRLKKIGKEASLELGQDSVMVVSDKINDSSFISGRKSNRIRNYKIGTQQIFT